MKGVIQVTDYTKTATGWRKTGERIELASEIDASHWRKWQQFDGNGARLIANSGLMFSYTTKSPDGTQKVKYKKLRVNYGGRRFLEIFDKFQNLSDKYYNTLKRRARKCAESAGIDFDTQAAAISSSSLHGFYFPNLPQGGGVFFVCGHPVILTDKDINEIIDGKRGL